MQLTIAHTDNEQEATGSTLGDVAGQLYIAAYFIVLLEPFVLIRPLPGSAAWAGLPLLGVSALALARPHRLARIPVSFSVVALAVWIAASLSWTSSFGPAFFVVRSQVPALILLCAVVGSMRRVDVVRALILTFAGIGAWSLATSLTMQMSRMAYLGEGPTLEIQDGWRGTFLHKNLLGVFALLGFTTTLAFVRRSGIRYPLLGLFIVLVLGTRSATAASGMVAVAVVWSWLTWLGRINNPRSRVLAKLASVALMGAAVASGLALVPALIGIYGKDLTFSGRTDIWSASMVTIRERPLLGNGAGSVWGDRFNPLTADLHRRIGFEAAHAHSGALDVLLAVGAIGLALYVVVVISTIRLAVSSLRTSAAPYGRWALVSLASIMMMSLSEPLFEGAMLGFVAVMWTLLAGFALEQRRLQEDVVGGDSTEVIA